MSRVALVSGANRGIGREVARALAQDDGMVVVGGVRDHAAELPEGVTAFRLDVTDPRSVDDVVLGLEREHGRLDVLVNNAGIYPGGRAATMDMAVADETWQVNALGAWRLATATLPLLRR